MSSGSHGVDWVHWLRKNLTRLRGTNFCTCSAHFAPSFVSQPNSPKCTKIVRTHQNMSLGYNGVHRVRSLRKILTQLRGTNFCTSSASFAVSFVSQLNGPKCTKILWNAPKHFFRVQWGGSGAFIAKNSDATSWHDLLHHYDHFAPSFVTQPNGPQCTKIVRNTPNTWV